MNPRGTFVSGISAVSGNSIYSGDTVTVGSTGTAWLLLTGGAQARIGSGSEVRLTEASNAIQMEVLSGEVIFRSTPTGRLVGRVADGTFQPASSGLALGRITLDEGSGRTQFAAERGNWMLATGSGSVMLRSGNMMTGQVAQSAGQVAVVVPKVYLARGTQKLVATPHAPVYWGDTVDTLQMARARVALDDGSVLNVGSQSSLQVVKENAGAQQTQLQLDYGRVRSKVVHLTKPGSSFQIRTRLGVAGVVGTDFYLDLEGNSLRLVVFEGVVRFCNLAGVCVMVRKKQTSQIIYGQLPSTPEPTPKGLLLEAENSTKVPSSVEVSQKPTNTEVNKKKHHHKALVLLVSGGVVGTVTGIVLALTTGGGQQQNNLTPVIP
jgi:hypothetical protein